MNAGNYLHDELLRLGARKLLLYPNFFDHNIPRSFVAMSPYKTELVNANTLYTRLLQLFGRSTNKYKEDDIIIA